MKIQSGICKECKHPMSCHDSQLGCTVSLMHQQNTQTNSFIDKNCPCEAGMVK